MTCFMPRGRNTTAMYTAKIADCTKRLVMGVTQTVAAGFSSNILNMLRRMVTDSEA